MACKSFLLSSDSLYWVYSECAETKMEPSCCESWGIMLGIIPILLSVIVALYKKEPKKIKIKS